MDKVLICLVVGAVLSVVYGQHNDQFTLEGLERPKVKVFFEPLNFNSKKRPGEPRDTHMCDTVTAIPRDLTFITRQGFYQKFTHAYDIPIVSSGRVSNNALKRACYVVRFLLADRRVIRRSLFKNWGRLGVIGVNEGTTSIPEHRHLGRWWDERARGLGGTLRIPISTGGEENLLCLRNDRYKNEDIFLHEFSHGISEVAIRGGAIPSYHARLNAAYNNAKRYGLWRSTYAMSTVQEYFAEGVQSFFEVNAYSSPPNGIHNHVNTRAKLKNYDQTLYDLIVEVFPCENIIKKRCDKSKKIIPFKMNCDEIKPSTTTMSPTTETSTTTIAPPDPFETTSPTTKMPSSSNSPSTTQNKTSILSTKPGTKTTSVQPPDSTVTTNTLAPPDPQTTTSTLAPSEATSSASTSAPPEPPTTTSTLAPPDPPTTTTTLAPPEPPTTTTTLAPPEPPTTKKTVPPPTRKRCRDTSGGYCYYYYYYCTTNTNFMRSCKLTCGCCNNPVDRNVNCGSWARRGECSRNPRYMLVYCKRSCCNIL